MDDEKLLLKYPFSSRNRFFLEKLNIAKVSGSELNDAKSFAVSVLSGRKNTGSDAREAVVSYVLARILLALTGNRYFLIKFASNEARNAKSLLENEEYDAFSEIAREFFPSFLEKNNECSVSLEDYLESGSDLANENVSEGRVVFPKEESFALLKKAIEGKISSFSFDMKALPEESRKNFSEEAMELKKELEKLNILEPRFSQFKGKYLNQECMQKVFKGLPEGKRYYGSVSLSIACLKDGLPKEAAEEVLKGYAKNSSSGSHPFSEREALASLDWVYRHPAINLSCKTMLEQGIIDSYCKNCVTRQAFFPKRRKT